MEGVISSTELDAKTRVYKARNAPGLMGIYLVKEVSIDKPYTHGQGLWDLEGGYTRPKDARFRVVAFDFGMKRNILRNLVSAGCAVTVVPASFSAKETLSMKPDGVVLSNGPGDPEAVPYAIENMRRLIGKIPLFGICLGHQLLSLALGGKTFKMKFGHRGANQPVMDLKTGKVEITSQNHGFAVSSAPELRTYERQNSPGKRAQGIALPSSTIEAYRRA